MVTNPYKTRTMTRPTNVWSTTADSTVSSTNCTCCDTYNDTSESTWEITATSDPYAEKYQDEEKPKIKLVYPKRCYDNKKALTKPYHVSVNKQVVMVRFLSMRR